MSLPLNQKCDKSVKFSIVGKSPTACSVLRLEFGFIDQIALLLHN